MSKSIEFHLPDPVRDFIFDLHEATRLSQRAEDVQRLYESTYKELTDKYFAHSSWPSAAAVASECRDDEVFLIFYREMRLRHLFAKLKPQLNDYMESWNNYKQLFAALTASSPVEMTLTPTWAYDLVQEFVYQFQEFCQYRCQINVNRSEEDIRTLTSHREVWSYPAVVQLLTGLIRASHITEFLVATPARETTHDAIMGSVQLLLGYFAIIELARLECLVGDHTASLQAVAPLRLLDKSEFFINVPSSYVNTLYHAGVCFIMSRRYADAMDTLGHLIVYVSNALKPGAASHMRISAPSQLQKIMDKAIALAGVSANLCPGHRLDDQVKELVASKLGDRLRRLQLGETNVYVEMFEGSCPKFVSPAIPTYRTPEKVNRCYEAVQLRVRAFAAEAAQESLLIKLRSYLRLYSAIDVEKLAGFVGLSRDDLLSLLISFKHKSHQVQSIANGRSTTASSEETLVSCDIGIHVRGSSVVVESTSGGSSSRDILLAEHFVSGIKKHAQINARVNRILP